MYGWKHQPEQASIRGLHETGDAQEPLRAIRMAQMSCKNRILALTLAKKDYEPPTKILVFPARA
jgi:hypothetical protein